MPRLVRPGAPSAPFLAQLYAQQHMNELTTYEIADRYEAAAALQVDPHAVSVATV